MATGFSTAQKIAHLGKRIDCIVIAMEGFKELYDILNEKVKIIEKEIKDDGK